MTCSKTSISSRGNSGGAEPGINGDLQGDLGLNIAEAHAFNTADCFTLDVFVVNGYTGAGGVEDLEEQLSQRLQELPAPGPQRAASGSSPAGDAQDLPFLIDFEQRRNVRSMQIELVSLIVVYPVPLIGHHRDFG